MLRLFLSNAQEISKLMHGSACGIQHPPWGMNTQENKALMPALCYHLQQMFLLWTTRRRAMADVILPCQKHNLNIIWGLFKYTQGKTGKNTLYKKHLILQHENYRRNGVIFTLQPLMHLKTIETWCPFMSVSPVHKCAQRLIHFHSPPYWWPV